jgi:hypothetical protein
MYTCARGNLFGLTGFLDGLLDSGPQTLPPIFFLIIHHHVSFNENTSIILLDSEIDVYLFVSSSCFASISLLGGYTGMLDGSHA